jgi:LCP family protein required for cell wall assembly
MPLRDSTAHPGATAPGQRQRAQGQRQLRLALRQQFRQEQNRRFRAFLGRASLGTLVPGLGLILGGRRRLGWALLLGFVAALLGAGAWLLTRPRAELLSLAVDPSVLLVASAALAVVALSLLLSSAASHHVLQPAGIRRSQRVVGATTIMVLTSLVVAPVALASRYAWVQHELVDTLFAAPEAAVGAAGSDPKAPPAADPWADTERVTVLLMGSDAGPGREGTRPDTNVVASVDTETGDAVLFSLPRNLEGAPFPAGSELAALYPYGWQGDPNDLGSGYLNAIYRYVPAAHPELFTKAKDPGAQAMMMAAEGITGLPVDYYVMVDLDGFQQMVDALGGIDINVRERIPLESSMLPSGICSAPTYYLEPGRQRLNGYEALWYARVRCGGPGLSDDYDRMRRQRCVIGAMIERSDPLTLLRRYEQLAGATKRIVSTDIPQDMVPAFAELALRVQDGSVRSLPFTNVVIDPASPDFAAIQAQVDKALEPPKKQRPGKNGSGGAATPGASPGATPSAPDESSGAVDLDAVC